LVLSETNLFKKWEKIQVITSLDKIQVITYQVYDILYTNLCMAFVGPGGVVFDSVLFLAVGQPVRGTQVATSNDAPSKCGFSMIKIDSYFWWAV